MKRRVSCLFLLHVGEGKAIACIAPLSAAEEHSSPPDPPIHLYPRAKPPLHARAFQKHSGRRQLLSNPFAYKARKQQPMRRRERTTRAGACCAAALPRACMAHEVGVRSYADRLTKQPSPPLHAFSPLVLHLTPLLAPIPPILSCSGLSQPGT